MEDMLCGFDNLHLDVTSQGREALGNALKLAWPKAPGGNATHSVEMRLNREMKHDPINGVATLILLWLPERGAQPLFDALGTLPFPYNLNLTARYIELWLGQIEYPDEPDHDGFNQKGFRIFTRNKWGQVAEYQSAICAIQPAWAMYGK